MNLRQIFSYKTTLTWLFAFHFILWFIITTLVIIHLLSLQNTRSNNPSGINSDSNKTPFHPYYTLKDILHLLFILLALLVLGLFFLDLLEDPDNDTLANSLNTPQPVKLDISYSSVQSFIQFTSLNLKGSYTSIFCLLFSSKQWSIAFPASSLCLFCILAATRIGTNMNCKPASRKSFLYYSSTSICVMFFYFNSYTTNKTTRK